MRYLSRLAASKIKNKHVLVRVDFNVTLDEKGQILDDFRIRACLPTISYLTKNRARVILASHLSKSQLTFGKAAGGKSSLRGIARYLGRLLGKKVIFIPDCRGEKVKKSAASLKAGQVALIENLRYYPEEEKNDPGFAEELAKLADLYVNDGFAVSHRAHASVEAVTRFLPSYAGLLLEKELKNLNRALKNPPRPLVVIIGGAKVSTKLKLVENFLKMRADVLLGGVIANTVLRAKGLNLGKSLVETEEMESTRKLDLFDVKLHLPVDVVVALSADAAVTRIRAAGNIGGDEIIFDIGPDAVDLFTRIIRQAKMIVWNGPMGLVEKKAFARGTETIAETIASSEGYSLIGGGDTVIMLNKLKLLERFSFVSTGGGAMLEYLAGKKLPGIEALEANKKEF